MKDSNPEYAEYYKSNIKAQPHRKKNSEEVLHVLYLIG